MVFGRIEEFSCSQYSQLGTSSLLKMTLQLCNTLLCRPFLNVTLSVLIYEARTDE